MKRTINDIADELQNRFLDENFIVQRYDAYTTRSIYIKLDYGVAHTIRVSDHKGYDRLSYRYNIRTDIKKSYHENDSKGFIRYYITPDDIDKFIKSVIDSRNKKINKIGEVGYSLEVQKRYLSNSQNFGFWTKCRQIRRKPNGVK